MEKTYIKCKMKYIIIFLTMIFLLSLVHSDTTFFDNPDDAFIMGNSTASSPTGGVIIEETTDETTDQGGCIYKWNCTDWSECSFPGKKTRNCTNIGTCLNIYKTPETEQKCIYTIFPKTIIEKKIWKEIINKNKIFLYFIAFLLTGLVIFYLKKKNKGFTSRQLFLNLPFSKSH